jgi:hypothetical protein
MAQPPMLGMGSGICTIKKDGTIVEFTLSIIMKTPEGKLGFPTVSHPFSTLGEACYTYGGKNEEGKDQYILIGHVTKMQNPIAFVTLSDNIKMP